MMTAILLKLFIKNYKETQNIAVRSSIGKFAGLAGIVCNCMLTIAKLAVGAFSGSIAIIADGVNNLSDAASSFMTLLGFRMAQRPADKQHPYGHARYEYLSALAVAVMILLIGAELAKSSIEKIISPEPVAVSPVTIALLAAAIAVKLWMSIFYGALGKMINSAALYAASADSRNDVAATTAVMIGCVVNYFFDLNVDGYLGLCVALFILYSGFGIARDTISPLLGQRADAAITDKITKLILSHEKVLGVHDLLVHDYGHGRCYASAHVELAAEDNPLICHDIIDSIERRAMEEAEVHLVIHHDPVVTNDAEQNEMHSVVSSIIHSIDPSFSIHDFRIMRDAAQSKLVFDLAVPYAAMDKQNEIRDKIETALNKNGKNYVTVICFDGIA